MAGFFGNLFNLNRNGKLGGFERAMEIHFMGELLQGNQSRSFSEDEEEGLTDLELAGIDPEELEFMDYDERCAVLEEAGLDPDEYDF